MNKEIKEKWVTALRSGNYKQGTHLLKRKTDDGDCFCATGVLADIWAKENNKEWMTRLDIVLEPRECIGICCNYCILPQEVMDWAQIIPNERDVFGPVIRLANGNIVSISSANDWHQLTFSELADLIESQL